jgi:hypothetical protein
MHHLPPPAKRTLELYISVRITSPMGVNRHIFFIFICKPIIASRRQAERGARCWRRGEVVRLLVDELVDPELELPPLTAIT